MKWGSGRQRQLLVRKKTHILEPVLGNGGTIWYYQRTYLYIVSGQEYTLDTVDIDSRPYKTIKYNPSNPYEAETYEGINTETIVIFFCFLNFIFWAFLLSVFSKFLISILYLKNNIPHM